MTNYEKIKENLTYERFKNGWSMCGLIQEYRGAKCANVSCKKCQKWLQEEYQEPVLDKVEKEYLSALIRPFRKKVEYIKKVDTHNTKGVYIDINLINDDYCSLPFFNPEDMYTRMESNKHYTLEELGL